MYVIILSKLVVFLEIWVSKFKQRKFWSIFMANIKSAEKRIEVSERNRLRNKSYKSTVKTLMKKTFVAISNLTSSNLIHVQEVMSLTYSKIDKAVQKGVWHVNNGNSKKARLSKYLKTREQLLSKS